MALGEDLAIPDEGAHLGLAATDDEAGGSGLVDLTAAFVDLARGLGDQALDLARGVGGIFYDRLEGDFADNAVAWKSVYATLDHTLFGLPAVIAAIVYLVDVRPAVRGLPRGNSW